MRSGVDSVGQSSPAIRNFEGFVRSALLSVRLAGPPVGSIRPGRKVEGRGRQLPEDTGGVAGGGRSTRWARSGRPATVPPRSRRRAKGSMRGAAPDPRMMPIGRGVGRCPQTGGQGPPRGGASRVPVLGGAGSSRSTADARGLGPGRNRATAGMRPQFDAIDARARYCVTSRPALPVDRDTASRPPCFPASRPLAASSRRRPSPPGSMVIGPPAFELDSDVNSTSITTYGRHPSQGPISPAFPGRFRHPPPPGPRVPDDCRGPGQVIPHRSDCLDPRPRPRGARVAE